MLKVRCSSSAWKCQTMRDALAGIARRRTCPASRPADFSVDPPGRVGACPASVTRDVGRSTRRSAAGCRGTPNVNGPSKATVICSSTTRLPSGRTCDGDVGSRQRDGTRLGRARDEKYEERRSAGERDASTSRACHSASEALRVGRGGRSCRGGAESGGVEADLRHLAVGGVLDLEELTLREAERCRRGCTAGNIWIALLNVRTVSL